MKQLANASACRAQLSSLTAQYTSVLVAFVISPILAACGAGQNVAQSPAPVPAPQAESTTASSTTTPTDHGETSKLESKGQGAGTGGQTAKADAHRTLTPVEQEAFLTACMGKMPNKDYCTCSMRVAEGVVPANEWQLGEMTEETKIALSKEASAQCKDTLKPDQVQAQFIKGCLQGLPRGDAYCSCAAKKIYAKLGIDGMVGLVAAAQVTELAETCSDKLSEELIYNRFLRGCSEKSSPVLCECMWKQLRRTFKAAELNNSKLPETQKFQQAIAQARPVCDKAATPKRR
jgi:hypothetical protein